MRKHTPVIALLVAGSLALTACGSDESTAVTTTMAPAETMAPTTDAPAEEGDIVATAVAAGNFTTLAAALEAAGLVETLQGEGPFTVFAPTDEAFAALPAGLVDALLKPENVDALKSILLYHVIAGSEVTADMVAAGDVEMANGEKATIAVEGGKVTIAGVEVTATDVQASNGVIHVLGGVMVPPSVDVDALLAG